MARLEWWQPAPEKGPPWSHLPEGEVQALLEPLASLHVVSRLDVRARVASERETFRWSRRDETLGSITLDHVGDGATGGKRKPYRELELELREGAPDVLRDARTALEDSLGFHPSAETKLSAALEAAGIQVPELDESPFKPHESDRLADVAVKNMGGENEAASRSILDDLVARGLRTPEFLITDGAAGLERALAALWPDVPAQRCTVHKHRNLLAHAPDALHHEVTVDYTDMMYAATAQEVQAKRRAFLRKWRLRCPAVASSLEEASDRLFTFLGLPPSQWRSARTTNAIERLHEEFKRRIKTQTVLPSAETAAMLFWALLASGQITMRKVDGWQTLADKPVPVFPLELAA